jgi:hypothetical protein
VWGRPDNATYTSLIQNLMLQYPESSSEKILDPVLGEVGTVLWSRPQAAPLAGLLRCPRINLPDLVIIGRNYHGDARIT